MIWGSCGIDNPPVNALSPETVADMIAAFDAFEADRSLAALIVECAGRTFVAGGDIAAFDDPSFSAVPFNTLLARIEASGRPVVAELFGTVLGGGLELALACHLRVADPATRLGLPEVTLGLVPGSLGTQRLPRLVGLEHAARMIVEGKPIDAKTAESIELVDEVAPDRAVAAREAARRAVREKSPLRRISALTIPNDRQTGAILADLKAKAQRQAHLPALAAIATCLEAAATLPFDQGEQIEADAFSRLLATSASRALRHVFMAERAAKRIPGLPAGTGIRDVRTVGVLGIGTMGAGISMTFANAGYPVTMVENGNEALERGKGIIEKTYAGSVERGRTLAGRGRPAKGPSHRND